MANIVKVQPFPATKTFSNGLMNEFFNRGISDFFGNDDWSLSQPAVNVTESKDAFKVSVAAPGFDKKDFSINVDNGYLTLEAKREAKTEEKSENSERFLRREFRYEAFKRAFKIPQTVNIDGVNAVYENGVLNVTLPKKEEAKPLSKTIEIG